MAACAISTVWGQPAAGGQDELSDRAKALLDQAKAMSERAVAVGAKGEGLGELVQSLKAQGWDQDAVRENADALREHAEAMAQDAVRVFEGANWKDLDNFQFPQMDLAMNLELAQDIAPRAPMAPIPPVPPMSRAFRYGDGGSYESGKNALDNHNYEKAVEIFEKVINARTPSTRADGAYYWKAYALNKLGKRDEALAALADLSKQFPQSSWLNDAKALGAEVQQAKGQPVSPENQADEDLKLYAINALINSDADRAVPLLEGLLGNPKMSPRLKERALFVLAQSQSEKAHDIVGRYAKGGSNPDLQLTAVQYLGTYRSKESRQLLYEVYGSVSDVNVKRAVLRSFEISRDVDHLTAIAKSEQNVDLRREAIRQLGNMHVDQEIANLVSLYSSESDREIKIEILNSLANQGAVKQMIDCARKESDPELKKVAVRRLGEMKSKEALDFIAELLSK
ncbi:MAG: tetratricopeptide repeat protein [Bryobacteraceae bacterium]